MTDKTVETAQKDPFAGFISSAVTPDGPAAADKAPAEPEKAPEAPQKPSDPLAEFSDAPEPEVSDEDEAEAAPEDEKTAEPAPDEQKKPNKVSAKARIRELTRARRDAENEAAALRAEVARLKTPAAPAQPEAQAKPPEPAPAPGEPSPPDPSKFKYGEVDAGYLKALNQYAVDLALAKVRAETARTAQEAAERQQAETLRRTAADLVEKGSAIHDDYEAVVVDGARQGRWQLSETVFTLAAQSQVGAETLYHLAKNPRESAKVAAMSDIEQARYFGRLETALAMAKKTATAQAQPLAPPPPRPRGSGGQFIASATSDFAAFEAQVMAQRKQAQK